MLGEQRVVQPVQDLAGRRVRVRGLGPDRVAGQGGQLGGLHAVPADVTHHGPPLPVGLKQVIEVADDLAPCPAGR